MSQYLCPECGSDSKVIGTRPSYSTLRRRRVCLSNNHRFSTFEVPIDSPEKIVDLLLFAINNASSMEDDMVGYVHQQVGTILQGSNQEKED